MVMGFFTKRRVETRPFREPSEATFMVSFVTCCSCFMPMGALEPTSTSFSMEISLIVVLTSWRLVNCNGSTVDNVHSKSLLG